MTKPPMSLVQIFLFGERVHLLQQLQYKGVSIQDNGKRYLMQIFILKQKTMNLFKIRNWGIIDKYLHSVKIVYPFQAQKSA